MFKITPKLLDQNGGAWCVTLISFDEWGWHFMVWGWSLLAVHPRPALWLFEELRRKKGNEMTKFVPKRGFRVPFRYEIGRERVTKQADIALNTDTRIAANSARTGTRAYKTWKNCPVRDFCHFCGKSMGDFDARCKASWVPGEWWTFTEAEGFKLWRADGKNL